ncbi:MAG: emrA [Polaromonas sp.]|nr:emrA [Polaromonas sp.]
MKLFTAAASGILVAGAVFAASAPIIPGAWVVGLRATSTENAFVRGDVTPLSPKITGYIAEVMVQDNQRVRTGELLYQIDDADYRARVMQAAATLNARRAATSNLDRRLELQRDVIQQAEAVLQGAEAESDRTRRDFLRTSQLTRGGWSSQARGEQAQSDSLRAEAKVAEAKANITAARHQVEVFESQRPQLLADIDAGIAGLRLAEIDLEGTRIRAPADGWVGERQARVGQ